MTMKVKCKASDLRAAVDDLWEQAHPQTCPECDGTNVSESGICWDCTASDYLEEERLIEPAVP